MATVYSKDSNHQDDLFQSRYLTPGFKLFSKDLLLDVHAVVKTIMHQSISAVPIPPPPQATTGHLLKCKSRGWGISKFIAARGLGISLPRGDPQAFDTRVFELTWKSLSERTRTS